MILSLSRPFWCCFGPFWGPRGYLNGPRVVQHDIYSCNIPMGSVLRSFGAFQGNIWSVAPFIPVGPGENQCCPHKTRIFSKSPNGPIFNFFLVVQNIVFDIIHSKIRPNNFFPYIRILTRCGDGETDCFLMD